jgi:hypothetical protein
VANPVRLNLLLQLLFGASVPTRIKALRIVEDLLKLGFPSEIFDKALEISERESKSD